MHVIGAILNHESSHDTSHTRPSNNEEEEAAAAMTDPPSYSSVTTSDPPAHNGTATSSAEEPPVPPTSAAATAAELARQAEMEARAVAEATATADASYVPTPSVLNAPTAAPLLRQVDGPSVEGYTGKESTYVAKRVPVPLRGKLDVPIHISTGGSVVSYEISTENYDIGFGINAEREEGVTVVTVSYL